MKQIKRNFFGRWESDFKQEIDWEYNYLINWYVFLLFRISEIDSRKDKTEKGDARSQDTCQVCSAVTILESCVEKYFKQTYKFKNVNIKK